MFFFGGGGLICPIMLASMAMLKTLILGLKFKLFFHLRRCTALILQSTIVEGNPKAPFSIATTPMCRGRRYSFPGLLYFTLDPYLIMLSVKQGGIKYHFF